MCWSWQSLYWPGSLRAVPPVCSSIHYIGFEPFLTFLFKLLVVVVWLLSHVQLLQPMDCCLPGSSVHGILQAKILEWVAISFSSSVKNAIHNLIGIHASVQFSSVTQLWPTLWDPMDCIMPGLPVHHQLPELAQTMSTESVMPSNHLILCCSLLLLPSIFPRIRVFSNESALQIRWPKYWSFSFNISSSNEYSGLTSFMIDGWTSLQSKGHSRVLSNTTVQNQQFFSAQVSL